MAGEQVKIKQTTIERGVRVKNPSGNEGDYSLVPVMAVAAMKQKHDHEKQVLHQLNDRFAKYVERVKFLESQNKKLLAELDELRHRWGEETRLIKDKYEPELLEARIKIDDATKEKALAEISSRRSEYEAIAFKKQYDDALNHLQSDKNKIGSLQYILQENQIELDLLRRQMHDAQTDIEKYKREVARLNEELLRLLGDLDEETLKRIKLENEKQTLEEQIPFLNAIHEQEINELRSLQAALHIDPTSFYRHELERAIRDIRGDFEELSEQQKLELEEWYKVKMEEMYQQAAKRDAELLASNKVESSANLQAQYGDGQRELNDLKQLNAELLLRLSQLEEELEFVRQNTSLTLEQKDKEIAEIKARLQELMADYDELMSNKASLEFEINTYRRLLESEESRTSRVVIESPPKPVKPVQVTPSAGEAAKTTFQRSAKGQVSISECSPDGKVIILENTSRSKDISITNWVLKRKVDTKDEVTYKFPPNLTLKAGKVVRVFARGQGKENFPSDLVNSSLDNWGVGANTVTILLNDNSEERATYLQKSL